LSNFFIILEKSTILIFRYVDRDDRNHPKPENYRFIAYRNIFFLIYGRTRAKMSRMPLPSCIVEKIRSTFPDPHHHYTGFQSKKKRH
jgi:hypothetical protein